MSKCVAFSLVLLAVFLGDSVRNAQSRPSLMRAQDRDKTQPPAIYVPSGRQIYKEHCTACHGSEGKGNGPVARSLRKPPSDLTTLAKRHGGAFPEEYVTSVLRFGLGFSAHGSSEMPVWGPIFQDIEQHNEAAVRQRVKNLCEYLESIQQN